MSVDASAAPYAAARTSGVAAAPGAAFAMACMLILMLQFGPAIGLAGFVLTGNRTWALIGLARDAIGMTLLLFGLWALLAASRPRVLPASVWWALGFVVACIALGLVAESGPLVLALNLRRLVFLPLLFVALWLIPWSPAQLRALVRLVLITGFAVASLGVAERLAPDSFWTEWLQIDAFTAANPFDRFGWIGFYEGGRFFNWDFERWLGTPLRRMVSTYLEPTTLGAGLVAVLCLVIAERSRGLRGALSSALLACAAILTLSKAVLLFLALLFLWRLSGWPSPRSVISLALIATTLALFAHARGLDEGSFAHLKGLATGLDALVDGWWFGIGIGEAGNYTDTGNDTGGESGIGNAIAQVGLLGFLPILWVRAIGREVVATAFLRGDPGGPWMASWLLFWLLSYLLSASSLGVGGNALGFAMLALYLHPASGGASPR